LINGGNNANGIELMRFGQKITLKAKNEVILSAGGIGSPQILLLSGIGPKQHLQSLNIDVMHDLQGVGENLQDHVLTSMWIKSANEEQIGVHPFSIVNPLHYFNYLIWGKGTLASNGIEAGAFFYSGVSNDTWKRPDIQLHTTSLTFFVDYGLMYKTALNLADNFFYGTYGDFENRLVGTNI
jgi:choline dehydrogenase-like flavoprotein